MARILQSSGVCVVGMLEKVQSRNLGDPAISLNGVRPSPKQFAREG